MDIIKKCTACNMKKIYNFKYKKDRTICKKSYDKKKREYYSISEQTSVNDGCVNIRTLLVGPIFLSGTHSLLKILPRKPVRDIYKITKSPPEQYSNSKIKNGKVGAEIKPLNHWKLLS